MNWLMLIIAGLFEVGFTTCLGHANKSSGNTFLFWIVGFFICLALSMYLLYRATSGSSALPLGTAYGVWTGIGAVGTALIGMLYFNEPVHFWRVFFLFTLIASIVGLKLVSH